MKNLKFLLTFYLILGSFVYSNNIERDCILAGSIHNPKENTISVNKQTVNLSSDGQFLYKFSMDKPGYIDVNMGKEIAFYFNPGDNLYLEIDPNEDLKLIKVRGDREKINQFLVKITLGIRTDFPMP